jgi:hypothetical protein
MVVLAAALGAFGYHLRVEGIFACRADGYSLDRYLAYCNSVGYGEYDHGAFWFELEPEATESARRAEVLLLGNSRMQLGFSTRAAEGWFSSRSIPHYLLGFSESERFLFTEALLNRIRPQAKVYVINIDRFFEPTESVSAQFVMHDRGASVRIQNQRSWQQIHRPICAAIPAICGRQYAVFRSPQTGAWTRAGGAFGSPVLTSDDPVADNKRVEQESPLGREFLLRLPVQPECVFFTIIPTVNTKRATANAITAALGRELLAPPIEGLRTFDGSHLDDESAERWSKAFFEAAGSRIEGCVAERPSFERQVFE